MNLPGGVSCSRYCFTKHNNVPHRQNVLRGGALLGLPFAQVRYELFGVSFSSQLTYSSCLLHGAEVRMKVPRIGHQPSSRRRVKHTVGQGPPLHDVHVNRSAPLFASELTHTQGWCRERGFVDDKTVMMIGGYTVARPGEGSVDSSDILTRGTQGEKEEGVEVVTKNLGRRGPRKHLWGAAGGGYV